MNLRDRCTNPSHTHYADYGGRGINYPKSWDSFETFLHEVEESIGHRPSIPKDALFNSQGIEYERYWSIDRINNDGNYKVGNIRWATPHEQKVNQRKRRWKKKSEGVV
jgi:hypothetical protein